MPSPRFPAFATKQEARAWALAYRRALPDEELRDISERAIARLTTTPAYREAQSLLTYVGSLPGELETLPLIEDALNAGKRVCVPVTRPNGEMSWSAVSNIDEFERSSRGILEPRVSPAMLREPEPGLCIVPGTCFRLDGHRIGFGGGYFDRFLAGFSGTAVALAPDALRAVDFPVEPHDRPVSAIITECGMYPAVAPISG